MKKSIVYLLIVCLTSTSYSFFANNDYLMPAKKYGRWGFITIDRNWVIDADFEGAYHFSEGLAAVKKYDQWGFIDRNGDWIIEPQFNEVKPFREGLACVKINGRWGYINRNGGWHFEPNLNAVSSFGDGKAVIKRDDGFIFINKEGDRILKNTFQSALPFTEGLASVQYNGVKGYIERNGNWLIKHNYEEAYSFSEGLALVMNEGKYGFIDQRGDLAIRPEFDDAYYFSEGLTVVRKGDRWGFIDNKGNIAIEMRFEAAFSFSSNYAVVKYDGRFGVIDQRGDWVINPSLSGLGRYTKAVSLQEQVEDYVKAMYAEWQLKGEFEKTSTYIDRISQDNREDQIQVFSAEAMNAIAKQQVRYTQSSVGLYEADYEKFNVFIPGAKSIMLPVPLEYAKEVKENWEDVWLGNPKYTLSGDKFLITSLEARYKGEVFYYDIRQDFHITANPTLDIHLEDITYDVPDMNLSSSAGLSTNLTVIGQSDVDVNIPKTSIQNPNLFALVIGNEDYSSYQMDLNTSSNVEFAEIDARTFQKYLVNTLGVPRENITTLINATAGQMKQSIARLSAIASAYEGEAELIFYYAGHGLPRQGTNDPYLIPVDVSGANLEYALKLEDVFNKLSENESRRVTVFLDACFTGGARNQGLVAARGVRVKPKTPFVMGNLVVFSASSEDQTAHPYQEKAHGIFTYYLLKGLQNTEGRISFGELEDFIRTNVMRKSVLVNNKVQMPKVKVSPVFENSWKSMNFY